MKINAEAVTIARMAREYTQTRLANSINVSQGLISKIEMGLIDEPDQEIIESLASELNFPKAFFFEEKELLDPGLKYLRARKSLSKKKINKIDSQLSIVTNSLSKLLRKVDFPDTNIPELDLSDFENVNEAALSLRDFWKVPRGPISNLTQLIEDNGGLVIHWDFETKKLDGLTFTPSSLPPVIFINKNLTGDRYRFTLAHELAHLVLHLATPYNPDQDKEADAFASEFMMPSDEIRESLFNLDFEVLASLKLYWKMSMQSILYKAKSLNILTDNQYRYWQMKFSSAGYRKREPKSTDFPIEQTELLNEIITVYQEDLNYSIEELLKILKLNQEDFNNWFLGVKNIRMKLIK